MDSLALNKQLCTKMPYLIPSIYRTDDSKNEYDYSYTMVDIVPEGWRLLFLQLNEAILPAIVDAGALHSFRWDDVKEKNGQLCLTAIGAPEGVQQIISKYEYLSSNICVVCGCPEAEPINNHYLGRALCRGCSPHKDRYINKDDYFPLVYQRIRRINDMVEVVDVDVEQEWLDYLVAWIGLQESEAAQNSSK